MNKTRFVRPLAFLCMGFSLYDTALFAQATPIGAPSGGSAEANAPAQITFAPQAGETAYQGSVPQGTASTTPIALTLGEAIRRGLKANLGLLTSEQSSRETRAERYRALAGLLPTVNGQISDTEQ